MGFHKLVDHDAMGDTHLSPMEIKLWQLTYHCLLKFSCPVLFRVCGPNAARRISQHIRFLVPTTHPRCHDVVAFLQGELQTEVREEQPETATEDWFWGVGVTVSEYNGCGTEFYLERSQQDLLCKQFAENLKRSLLEKQTPTKLN